MKAYDLVIIGAGAGGFAAAIKANELKIKTLLVNSGLPLGGTCVNVGCVSSKTLIYRSKILSLAKKGFAGIRFNLENLDFSKVIKEELNLVERLRKEKYQNVLLNLERVDFLEGKARFVSENELEVKGERIRAEKFVIAVGSKAIVPEIPGLKEAGFLTHIEALKLEKLPKTLLVLGAGPVGLEFAQMFARFGSKVYFVHRSERPLKFADEFLVKKLLEHLSKEGVEIFLSANLSRVELKNGKKMVYLEKEREVKRFEVEEILVATGKAPNTSDLGLEEAGVEIDERSFVKVNRFLQTSNPKIFAVGDCVSLPFRLETTAGREGTLAVENAFEGKSSSLDYREVPYTIFTDPELAGVGWTEEQQVKELGICSCRLFSFENLPKANIEEKIHGWARMVVDPKSLKIQGFHVLSERASELVYSATVLIRKRANLKEIAEILPVFPSYSEVFKYLALSFEKDVSKLSCCI